MSMLKRGSSGPAVRALQEILGVDADGVFGADTEAAVKEHQQSEGLGADGIAGPDTLATLGLWNHITVAEGSRGNVVKKVQAALGIGADGVFGAGTKKAVMAFQKEKGIVADGVVGPATLHHLNIME